MADCDISNPPPTASDSCIIIIGDTFQKRIIDEGTGITKPTEGSLCTVHITTVDSSSPPSINEDVVGYPVVVESEICLGTGVGVLSAVFDQCLESMKAEEKCEMTLTEDMMIKAVGLETIKRLDRSVGEGGRRWTFVVYLVKFTPPSKNIWDMTAGEKLSRASECKDLGTECFKESRTSRAEWFYLQGLKYVVASGPEKDVIESNEYRNLKLALSLNIAACKLRLQRYEHAVVHCYNALDIDANNVKGLFRRGQALMEQQEYGSAKSDFEQILKLEPNNRAVHGQLKVLEDKVKRLDNHYATAMSKMFGSSS